MSTPSITQQIAIVVYFIGHTLAFKVLKRLLHIA